MTFILSLFVLLVKPHNGKHLEQHGHLNSMETHSFIQSFNLASNEEILFLLPTQSPFTWASTSKARADDQG